MFFKEKQEYEIFTGKYNTDYLLADAPLSLYCVIDPTQTAIVYAYSMTEQFSMKAKRVKLDSLKK